MFRYGQSKSVDLDKVIEVAKTNPANAIMMLCVYLKIQSSASKVKKDE